MRVAVLGSEGLIGRSLCRSLKEIDVIDRIDSYDILNGECQDLKKKEVFNEPYDYCFFLACNTGGIKYLEKEQNQINIIRDNMEIYLNIFDKLKKYNTPFLFVSSQLEQERSGYGAIKRLGEEYTKLLGGQIVRLWNVYGYEPIGNKSHVIPDFIFQAIKNKKIECLSDGNERRQFLYDYDCAQGLITIMKNRDLKLVDLTSRQWLSVKELATLIGKLVDAEVTFTDKHYPGYTYIEPTHNEIHKIWKMRYSIEDGIKELIKLYKKEV